MRGRKRILLLRSGRHLRVAMDALATYSPGCHIGVVGTPGSEAAIEQAGVAPRDRFVYAARFQPLRFLFSSTGLRARCWRYDAVAVLWNDPDGTGQGNVDRTALVMNPRGFVAITPDGSIVERKLWPQIRTECLRVAASLGVGVALALLLYVPGFVFSMTRRASGAARRACPTGRSPLRVRGNGRRTDPAATRFAARVPAETTEAA
jgi:hypothetical protein